eukprot:9474606-Pyramimonas_sp.AAC.1
MAVSWPSRLTPRKLGHGRRAPPFFQGESAVDGCADFCSFLLGEYNLVFPQSAHHRISCVSREKIGRSRFVLTPPFTRATRSAPCRGIEIYVAKGTSGARAQALAGVWGSSRARRARIMIMQNEPCTRAIAR